MARKAISNCRCCGKPLTDPTSVDLAIGPVCRMQIKYWEARNGTGSLFANRSDYDFSIEDGVVCIIDKDNGKTVTNDIHDVLADLRGAGVDIDSQPIIYRDTSGVWDRILVVDGRFVEFESINEREKRAAKAKALGVKPDPAKRPERAPEQLGLKGVV